MIAQKKNKILDKKFFSKFDWGASFYICFMKIGMKKAFDLLNRIPGGARAKNEPKQFKMASDSRWQPK